MKIGFTGTQNGMTEKQKMKFARLILDLYPSEFHHGDCVGADAEAHRIVRFFDFHHQKPPCQLRIIIHPPINDSKRAFCGGEALLPKDYLSRNHDIVDSTDLLIACPKGSKEETRSGTWATVRYARKKMKKIWIIYPDKRVEFSEPF